MSNSTPKDSDILKTQKQTREAKSASTSNPTKLLKTPKLPIKLEFSQDQGTTIPCSQNND